MKMTFKSSNKNAKKVSNSYGTQVIPCILENDGDTVVLIVDRIEESFFVNKLINKNGRFGTDPYNSDNFLKIEDDMEYAMYYKAFQDTGIFSEPL